jgi:hypothetical protein
MDTTEIHLYEILKARLGAREAEALVTFLEKKVDKKFDNSLLSIASKEDVANAKTDVIRWVFAFFVTLAVMIIGLYLK